MRCRYGTCDGPAPDPYYLMRIRHMADRKPSSGPGLGERIRARRTALGLTLAEVAEAAELSIPYVSNLERGRGNPTLDALRSVARALQQSVTELLGAPESEEGFDPVELVLAEAPQSLRAFSRSDRFRSAAQRLSTEQQVSPQEMGKRLMVGMASAPRRSAGEPTEEDWRRLLDAYSLILGDE